MKGSAFGMTRALPKVKNLGGPGCSLSSQRLSGAYPATRPALQEQEHKVLLCPSVEGRVGVIADVQTGYFCGRVSCGRTQRTSAFERAGKVP